MVSSSGSSAGVTGVTGRFARGLRKRARAVRVSHTDTARGRPRCNLNNIFAAHIFAAAKYHFFCKFCSSDSLSDFFFWALDFKVLNTDSLRSSSRRFVLLAAREACNLFEGDIFLR